MKPKNETNKGNVTNGFLSLVENLLSVQQEIKELYAEQESLMTAILSHKVKPGVVFEVEVGNAAVGIEMKQFTIKDNFAGSNTAFRAAAVKRFEVVEFKEKKGK